MIPYIIAGLLVGGSLFALLLRKEKSPPKRNKADPPAVRDQLINEKEILGTIKRFFENYCEKQKNHALYNTFAIRYGVQLPKPEEEPNTPRGIGTLRDLNLEGSQMDSGRDILRRMTSDLTREETTHYTQSRCISFLLEYKEIEGKRRALNQVQDQLERETIENIKKELEQETRSLIEEVVSEE